MLATFLALKAYSVSASNAVSVFIFTSVTPSQQGDTIVLFCLASSSGLFQGPGVEEHLSCTTQSGALALWAWLHTVT